MYPDEFWTSFYQRKVNIQVKVTFISSMLFGFIAHMFMLTNKLPNYDDIHCLLDDYGAGVEFGRWMLFILGNIMRHTVGNVSLPWLNGLICVILVSLSAVIVVSILEIKSKLFCGLTGAIMISFPALTGTLFFMYTAIYYCMAILLIALSVKCVKDSKLGYLFGMALIAAGVGIYQAYFAWAVSLFLLFLLSEGLNTETEGKNIFFLGLKCLTVLAGSLLVYVGCVYLFLPIKGGELAGYQSLNQMGQINIKDIPVLIVRAYQNYLFLMKRNVSGLNATWVVRTIQIILNLTVLLLLVPVMRKKIKSQQILSVIVILGIIILFPLAVNLIYVMSANSSVYSIMLYSVVSIYLLPIVVIERTVDGRQLSVLCSWIGGILLAIVVVCQCQFSNIQYLAMHMQFEQASSYFTTLVTQVKSLTGYRSTMKVALIGENIHDSSFFYNSEFDEYGMGGRSNDLINIYSRDDFLRRYLGYQQEIIQNTDVWETLPEVVSMPSYPEDGSIKIIDGTIVIKVEK